MNEAEKELVLCEISRMVSHMEPCGSRVTCNPPPMDTDEDFLLFVGAEFKDDLTEETADHRMFLLEVHLRDRGWERGGDDSYAGDASPFQSWTLNELNLIITDDLEFYHRHQRATRICKILNVMQKEHRIMIFQAVLYGNDYEPLC